MVDTKNDGGGSPRPKRRHKWLLAASLVLNAFLIALLLAPIFWDKKKGPRRPGGLEMRVLHRALEDCPADFREATKQRIAETLRKRDDRRVEFIKQMRAQADVIGADEFDVAALEKIYAEMQDVRDARRGQTRALVSDVLADATPDCRKSYATALRDLAHRFEERMNRQGDGGRR